MFKSFCLSSRALRFALLIMLLLPISIYASTTSAGDDPIPIVLEPSPYNPENPPRGSVFNPFSAELYNQTLTLDCTSYYGDVFVTLISTAGDNYSETFHTENGSLIIPISGNTGYYQLTLLTESSQSFIGEFYL